MPRKRKMKRRFVLSTEHSASSYGFPVLVDPETNIAYGPADKLPAEIARNGTAWTYVCHAMWYGWYFGDDSQSEMANKFLTEGRLLQGQNR